MTTTHKVSVNPKKSISERIDTYFEKKTEYEEAKAAATEIYRHLRALESSILDHMSMQKLEKLGTESGSVSKVLKTTVAKTELDPTELHEWLKNEGYDDLMNYDIHHAKLNSVVQERLDNQEDLPEFILNKLKTQRYLRVS